MSKPVMLSDENYSILNRMRKEIGEKRFETFDSVMTRILAVVVKKDE